MTFRCPVNILNSVGLIESSRIYRIIENARPKVQPLATTAEYFPRGDYHTENDFVTNVVHL